MVVPESTTMVDPAGRVARSGSPLAMPRRSGRVVRASSKISTALNTFEKATAEVDESDVQSGRADSVEPEVVVASESRKARSNVETGRNMFQKLMELMEKSYEETKALKAKVVEQTLAIEKHDEVIRNLSDATTQQDKSIKELQQQLQDAKAELTEVRMQFEAFTAGTTRVTEHSSPQATYAEVARTPPGSAPSNLRTISSGITSPSTVTNTLYCTIDGSRVAVEDAVKVTAGGI